LHAWGKKRFIESYLAWEEIEENQLLLPDGDLKNLLAGVAAAKALPPSIAPLPEPAAYSYTPAIAAAGKSEQADRKMAAKAAVPIRETPRIVDVEGRLKDLEVQAKAMQAKYRLLARQCSRHRCLERRAPMGRKSSHWRI
jgi:type III secretion system FlhB-like substrate exporter